MHRIFHVSQRSSQPFAIGDGDSSSGARLGGRAPDGVAPRSAKLKYFFTLTVPGFFWPEVSVFIDDDLDFIFGDEAGLLTGDSRVELVWHASSRRGAPTLYDSPLTEHPLVYQAVRDDCVTLDDMRTPYSGHKLGGAPFYANDDPELVDSVTDAMRRGFIHLVQIDFPGNKGDADVSGPWPIGTSLFHVLIRLADDEFETLAFWQQ